jgi:hypothetical protein
MSDHSKDMSFNRDKASTWPMPQDGETAASALFALEAGSNLVGDEKGNKVFSSLQVELPSRRWLELASGSSSP